MAVLFVQIGKYRGVMRLMLFEGLDEMTGLVFFLFFCFLLVFLQEFLAA